MTSNRIKWIDSAKFIAICAVVLDHSYLTLYTNENVGKLTYFSVGLFVLLSGISNMLVADKKSAIMTDMKLLSETSRKSIINMLKQYSLATFIIYIAQDKFFDLKTYLRYLVNFNLLGPFYFIVFFLQILIVSPVILLWINRISSLKNNIMIHLISMAALILFAKIFMERSFVLKLHGGGQYLMGGTFLIFFYIGGMLYQKNVFHIKGRRRMILMVCSAVLTVLSGFSICNGRYLDALSGYFLGEGINPPGFDSIIYTFSVLLLLYSVFFLLGGS